MAIKTQLRMLQVTASLPSIIDLLPATPTALTTNSDNSFPAGDLSGSLAYFAQTIQNIHGEKIIGDRAPGLIEHANASIIRRGKNSGGAQSIRLGQNDGTADDGLLFELDSTGTATASKVLIQNNRGTAVDAIKIETAAAGDVLVDSGKDITLLAAGVLDLDGASSTLDTTGTQLFDAGDDITVKVADTKSIFIGEGNRATETRLEVTHDAGAAQNEKIILHNQGGSQPNAIELKTATSGAGIKLDAAGVVFAEAGLGVDLIADGNNGFAILGATGGGGNEQTVLVSSGTTQGAMQLQSKGGIDIIPAAGAVDVDIGRLSSAQIVVAPHTNAANRDIRVLNTGGTDAKAIEVLATAGGVHVAGTQVILSGSGADAISFAGDGGMTSGPGSAGMLFAENAEYATFRGKSTFSAATTVVGALNALADSISGGSATIFTGSITAPVLQGVAVPATVIGKLSGDNANLVPDVDRGQVQVYLNGQLLVSASNQGGNTLANDYAITGNNAITFQFQLEPGDFINVFDRS